MLHKEMEKPDMLFLLGLVLLALICLTEHKFTITLGLSE